MNKDVVSRLRQTCRFLKQTSIWQRPPERHVALTRTADHDLLIVEQTLQTLNESDKSEHEIK